MFIFGQPVLLKLSWLCLHTLHVASTQVFGLHENVAADHLPGHETSAENAKKTENRN